MEKEYFNVLIFSEENSNTRHFKMRKETIKIGSSLLVFALLSTMFLFCDYIQVRKKVFYLNQVRQEVQVRRSQIQLLSARIGDLEEQLSKMKDFDRRIRIVANLERSQDTTPFIGMGGLSLSVVQGMSKEEKDGSFRLDSYSLP